jgi:acetolactate synthase I/II/III large subunit
MQHHVRGADLVARTLEMAGTRTLFTLSGNHIMPLFDALFDSGVALVHVRHEAAAVRMADAWGRLTGRCGLPASAAEPVFANAAADCARRRPPSRPCC